MFSYLPRIWTKISVHEWRCKFFVRTLEVIQDSFVSQHYSQSYITKLFLVFIQCKNPNSDFILIQWFCTVLNLIFAITFFCGADFLFHMLQLVFPIEFCFVLIFACENYKFQYQYSKIPFLWFLLYLTTLHPLTMSQSDKR